MSSVVSHDPRSIVLVADPVARLYSKKIRVDGPLNQIRPKGDTVVRQFFSGDPDGSMETT